MKRLFVDDFGLTVLGFLTLVFSSMILVTALVVWGEVAVERHACETTLANNIQLETNYDFPAGCFVKVDDKWIPESRWIENTGN